MPEIFEAITSVFKSFVDDEPKPPIHVGEVMNCWAYLAILESALGITQVALNTTTDSELSSALHEEANMIKMQMNDLKEFLINEGIPLPQATEEKPKCDSNEIPEGAKLSDNTIANELSIKVAISTLLASKSAVESIRNDVGMMFTKSFTQKMVYGATLKALMKRRGWLNIPPSYHTSIQK